MKHIVEVDQSGKVEDTSLDTVLAFANGKRHSVLIPSIVKRDALIFLRKSGLRGNTLYIYLFVIALYFLLRDNIINFYRVSIDTEYQGKENQIKEQLINRLRSSGYAVDPEQIQFVHVGKKSPAHDCAWNTLRRKEKPTQILTLRNILSGLRQQKNRGPQSWGKS